jgi:hypothetical protein
MYQAKANQNVPTIKDISIGELRQKKIYRFYESLLAITVVIIFGLVIIGSIFSPTITSMCLLIYGFFWLLKIGLNTVHTVYGFKQVNLWKQIKWNTLINKMALSPKEGMTELQNYTLSIGKNSLEFKKQINSDINSLKQLETSGQTVFANPFNIYHGIMFSTYNESAQVLLDSIEAIYNSNYPLDKILVLIAQEERIGMTHVNDIQSKLSGADFIKTHQHGITFDDYNVIRELDHKISSYNNLTLDNLKLVNDKINIFYVTHPDGLVGEIKGKAANEDYCARHLSLIFKGINKVGISSDLLLVSSFDADSTLAKDYLQMLSYRYCLSANKNKIGFQSVPVFANNYFDTHTWPRVVAGNTTLWTISQIATQDESKFFSTYCVPMPVLQDINFWQRDVIGEDATCFTKAYVKYSGDFHVNFFYGVFTGDSMESDNYGNAVEAQYLQLRRWAWGGVENFPFILYNFFHTAQGKTIPLGKRLVFAFKEFYNHGAWSTTPILFSVGTFLPTIFNDSNYINSPAYKNMSELTSWFARIAFVNIIVFSIITYTLILSYNNQKLSLKNLTKITYQSLLSSVMYVLAGIPAIDSQFRGLFGKYLGYWVAPKK